MEFCLGAARRPCLQCNAEFYRGVRLPLPQFRFGHGHDRLLGRLPPRLLQAAEPYLERLYAGRAVEIPDRNVGGDDAAGAGHGAATAAVPTAVSAAAISAAAVSVIDPRLTARQNKLRELATARVTAPFSSAE